MPITNKMQAVAYEYVNIPAFSIPFILVTIIVNINDVKEYNVAPIMFQITLLVFCFNMFVIWWDKIIKRFM